MKHLLWLSLFLGAFFSVTAAELEARLDPDTVLAGESFTLVISTSGRNAPELQEAPKGFEYAGNSHSTSIVNGSRTESVGYRFNAPAPGDYTIPPLAVKVGNSTEKTPELRLKVLKADASTVPGADEITFQGAFGSDRTRYYVGEEIPLFLTLLWPDSIELGRQTTYPAVNAGKSVFHDFRAANPNAPNFAPARQNRRSVNGKLFNSVTFPTIFRPLAAGPLQVESSITAEVLIPEKRRSRDSFFDDFFGSGYKQIMRTLETKLPPLTIVPLPPVPAGGKYLGLIGDYRGTATLSPEKIEVQEPLTLTLTVQGTGSFETLQVPTISIEGFRAYPGESESKNGLCRIRYALIPLKSGDLPVQVKFLFFAPEKEEYQIIELDKRLAVAPSTRPQAAMTVLPETPPDGEPETVKAPTAPRTTLLYCKTAPGAIVLQPWYRNQLGWIIVFLLGGPVFFVLHAWREKRRTLRAADTGYQRRERAGSRKKALGKMVCECPDEELPKLVTGEVTAFLSDRWGLAQGATPEEIAQKAHDPALAEVLRQCSKASYLPAELAKQALPDTAKVRRVILKALKLLLLVFLPLGVVHAEEAAKAPATWSEALSAYDRGDLAAAEQFFADYLKTNGDDPNALYNLGCIADAAGKPERSLWYFEKAHLLSPQDSAIQENCNVLRRKFFQPEIGTSSTPQEMLFSWRDHWRPDHYLLTVTVLWSLLWILAAFRHQVPGRIYWSGEILGVLLLVICAIAGITEAASTYRNDRGIVTVKSADVSTFPSAGNGRKAGALQGGTPVDILERRQEYLHVLGGELEGWVNSHEIGELP